MKTLFQAFVLKFQLVPLHDGSGNDCNDGGQQRRVANGNGGSGNGSGGNGSGNGSGGNGSGGNGSDPASHAAAAAAAVAAARRPKFHVLLASHDAAAQDLLLLRQVAWESLMLVEVGLALVTLFGSQTVSSTISTACV